MFENFPYTDFHQLNLDWIIKIAKDFLDQYTHIQEIIAAGEESILNKTEAGEQSIQNKTTDGLQELEDKATNLESLLQQWYDSHSLDIANQLSLALQDLNTWYTQHENYLDQTLATNIAAFNTAAENKAATTIASIPSDYTTLSNNVSNLSSSLSQFKTTGKDAGLEYVLAWENAKINDAGTGTEYSANHLLSEEYYCDTYLDIYPLDFTFGYWVYKKNGSTWEIVKDYSHNFVFHELKGETIRIQCIVYQGSPEDIYANIHIAESNANDFIIEPVINSIFENNGNVLFKAKWHQHTISSYKLYPYSTNYYSTQELPIINANLKLVVGSGLTVYIAKISYTNQTNTIASYTTGTHYFNLYNSGDAFMVLINKTSITEADIAGVSLTVNSRFIGEPDSTYDFTVTLNCNTPINSNNTYALDSVLSYTDNGFVMLPSNYNKNGDPVRLVIACHGAGTTSMKDYVPAQYLVANGFAVMDMMGMPAGYATAKGFNQYNNMGCPIAMQSYVKGYHYVIENFNVYPDVILFGASMGGLSSANIALNGIIPVIAHAAYCPVLDTYNEPFLHPWGENNASKTALSIIYDFAIENGEYVYDETKVCGYNPINRKVTVGGTDYTPYPCPIKIWHCQNDDTVAFSVTQQFVNQIKNAGGNAILRPIASNSHQPQLVGTPVADPSGNTNFRGTTLTIYPMVEELLLWVARYN